MMSLVPQSIRVPVDSLKEYADRLAELSESVRDYFDQLGNATVNLSARGAWAGDDAEAFIQANTANQKKYDKIIEDLKNMAETLRKYALEMETVDHEWAERIRSLG